MGLLAPLADFMLHEHRSRPISGDVLFIGRQTVFLTEHTLGELLKRHGLQNQASGPVEFDNDTVGAKGHKCITDRYFMRSLGVENVRFLDVTNYENADIIHDLGYPVDESLHSRFDFIYNGGCLDNMFNPGVALMSMSKMLRSGGRIICMESAGSWNDPYLMYSPGWFHDYFTINGFRDCRTYIASYRDNAELFYGPWRMHFVNISVNRNGPAPDAGPNNRLLVLAVSEKGEHSTSEKQPIQHQYRVSSKWITEFDQNESIIAAATRSRLGEMPPQYLVPAGVLGLGLTPSA